MMHYQDFCGNRGWAGEPLYIDPSELDGLIPEAFADGPLVTVRGKPFEVRAGIWGERTTTVCPWAQISPITGEVVYVSGIRRNSTPGEVVAIVRDLIAKVAAH